MLEGEEDGNVPQRSASVAIKRMKASISVASITAPHSCIDSRVLGNESVPHPLSVVMQVLGDENGDNVVWR